MNIGHLADKIGHVNAILASAKAGFDAMDMSFIGMRYGRSPFLGDDYKERCDEYLALAKEHGMVFNQAHAPYGSPYAVTEKECVPHFERMFECCARLGVKTVVIHPVQDGQFYLREDEMLRKAIDYYKGLIPMAREYGVKIATENMWQRDPSRNGLIVDDTCASPKHFCAVVDGVDSEWLTACLDIGHVVLCGRDPADFIRRLGRDRLTALHVHDNDCLDDLHAAPFTGKLDWQGFASALGEIDYTGDLTYEVIENIISAPDELCPAVLDYLHASGRYLINKINEARR